MKFLRLRLTNIGAFYGNYDFDLSTTGRDQNVILIGGQNGAGKTTILDSIRLALFGPLTYGLKTESSAYLETIEARLNNTAKACGEEIYRIILDVEQTENYNTNRYTIKRSWRRTKSGIKEEFSVQQNQVLLNDRDTEIFQEKLREEYPPQLLELCLFDGEQISQVVTNNTFSGYLRTASRVLFNLDLFESLEDDLRNLIKQDTIYQDLSQDEQSLQELLDEESFKGQTLENLRQRISELTAKIEDERALTNELNRKFDVYGGLKKDKRDKLLREIQELDHERVVMMEQTKNFITTLLPFFLNMSLLKIVQSQLQSEVLHEQWQYVSETISVSRICEALSQLETDQLLNTSCEPGELAEKIHSLLVPPSVSSVSVIHRASYQQRAEVESVIRKVENTDINAIKESFKGNTEMIASIHELRAKLDENDSSDDIRNLLDEIHDFERSIETLEHTREQLLVSLETATNELAELQPKIEQLKQKVIGSRKAKNVFAIVDKVRLLSLDFRQLQTRKKLQQVEITVANMLKELFRKELFIVRIAIHPETFDMVLFNDLSEEVNKERLSAGEKHILLLSTIWAMVNCSGRSMPFVFDTLLGRLDQKHKERIINHFIPRCGEQVIVLSTDSEIDNDHFEDIRRRVAKSYTIDHDVRQSRVHVLPDTYFAYSGVAEVSL